MKEVFWVIPGRLAGRCGPQLVPWDSKELRAGGVQAVVSLAGPVDGQELGLARIEHLPLYLPAVLLISEEDFDLFLSYVPPFLDFADRALGMDKPVMVHCTYGCDRTGAMLAAYLVARHGLSPHEAIAKVRSVRPQAMSAAGYDEVVHRFAASRGAT